MKISVVGGGYVGLVSSTCLAELGHDVEIIEIFEDKVRSINLGIPPIYEQGLQEMLSRHAGNRLKATTDYSDIANSNVILICVGTPPKNDGSADLSMIASASKAIGEALKDSKDYHVVAVKSTVPPGTTRNVVMPTVLEHSGKCSGEVGFVMNPEFLREGLAVQDFMNPDRIVIGSYDEAAGDLFAPIYQGLKAPMVRTSLTAAEMIKYASNAFLATKISFSNELGNVCKRLGIDVYEVMNGVGMDHRISPHFLNAGAGFGGSCFPKDVSALIHLAKDVGEDPILLKSVVEVNERQPMRIIELLEKRVGNLAGKKVAVLGLAFKNDTDDARESRSIPVIAELIARGAKVKAYDPKANSSMSKIYPAIDYFQSASDALKDADACLVMTEWPEFRNLDKEFDLMRSRAIIDARKVLSCKDAEGICW
ncbi:MAG: UDP-glucose/GDP-mannose dehydrogenase family protein [Methanothrix sp.]|nr:MAG: UDP-glucose/GDP-mannose dehydrogenase family protein [Methanothrix sp.]